MVKARKKQSQATGVIEPRPACADQYFGNWLVQPARLTERLEMFRAGALKPQAFFDGESLDDETSAKKKKPMYDRIGNVAAVQMYGEMLKGESSFGGTVSTVRIRRAIRAAAADTGVKAIMLDIDSPGGTVAGTAELADDVLAAREVKPVHAHISDLGASAAYWVASQADRVTTNRTSLVGSLGTMATLVDESGALDKIGIKVHVVSTGDHKGDGADGKVTTEMIDDAQRIVDDINEHFIAAVRSGRGFDDKKTRELFDGRVHVGTEAQRLGLVDQVSSFDEAMANLNKELNAMTDQEYAAYNAEHPDKLLAAASGLIDKAAKDAHVKGHAEGVNEERERCKRIASMSKDAAIVSKHIDSGSSPAVVKDELFEAQQAEIKALRDQVAKSNKSGGHPGVSVDVPAREAAAKPDGSDPKALAEWEFDNNQTVWKASTKERYVASRTAELRGQLRSVIKSA